jgi:phosphoribosyl-ATP pyrophosphohydrolase
VVVAANTEDEGRLASEAADLLYHLLVLLRARGVPLDTVWAELESRSR